MTSSPRELPARERLRRFEQVYRQHFRLIWSVVGRAGMRSLEREDVAQEVWLTVHRRLHTLRPDASTQAWLCSIAQRVAFRHRRSAIRADRRLAALAREPEAEVADPDRRYAAATTIGEVLASMSDDQRRVLVLAQVHGLSAPEIAVGLGVPINTVYSRLRLARERIDRFVSEQDLGDALDRVEEPPADASSRVWALLLPQMKVPAVVAVGSGFAALKSTIVGALAGGVVLVGVLVGATEQRETTSPGLARAEAGAGRGPEQEQSLNQDQNQNQSLNQDQNQSLNQDQDQDQNQSQDQDQDRDRNPDPDQRSHSNPKPGPRPRVAPGPSPNAGASMGLDAALLERANRALAGGRPLVALNLLEQHGREFADSHLADARMGATVRALCGLGRHADAREHAQRLRREYPRSSVTAAIGDGC